MELDCGAGRVSCIASDIMNVTYNLSETFHHDSKAFFFCSLLLNCFETDMSSLWLHSTGRRLCARLPVPALCLLCARLPVPALCSSPCACSVGPHQAQCPPSLLTSLHSASLSCLFPLHKLYLSLISRRYFSPLEIKS